MIRLHEQVTLPRTRRDCFRYLRDFSTSEQWDPGVYRAIKLTPGAPGEGSEFDLTIVSMGRRLPMRYRLVSVIEDRELVLHGEGPGFTVEDRIRFDDQADGGTRIDYQADFRFTGLPDTLLRPWLGRLGKQAVAGLRRALMPPAPPVSGWLENLGHRMILPAAWSFTERGYLAMPDKGLSEFVDGRTFVVTGATSGLGLAAACELARLGGRVLLVGRDPERLADAVEQVRDFSGCGGEKLLCLEADLSLVSEVERVSREIVRHAPSLDGLINNAGALFGERTETREGHERTLAINLICPWVLTRQLMPVLRQAGGRVVNVASGGMYLQPLDPDDMSYRHGHFDGSKAYARAKRALVAVTEHWAETVDGVDFHSMHPGWAATPGVARSLPAFNQRMKNRLRDSRMGADTMIWLATSQAVAGDSGRFWFDRRPRPTAVLPGTRVTDTQRQQLLEWLAAIG